MTPATWADIQDDLDAALRAADLALRKAAALEEVPPDYRADREIAIGKHLHDAFSAAEKALQRMVLAVDKDLPAGSDFHRALIERAARPVPQGRGPILTADTAEKLLILMRFRHLFRHLYETFVFPRARENLAVAEVVIPRLRDEITAFAAGLGLAPRA